MITDSNVPHTTKQSSQVIYVIVTIMETTTRGLRHSVRAVFCKSPSQFREDKKYGMPTKTQLMLYFHQTLFLNATNTLNFL